MKSIPINTTDSPNVILELIYRLKVKDAMCKNLITASRSDSLRHIQRLMKQNGITGIPVAEEGRLFGIVSMDDIIHALDAGYIDEPGERHMSKNLVVLEDDMPLSFGISYLDKYKYGRFPVLDKKKRLVGIITSRDIITCLLVEINTEMQKLEHKIETSATSPKKTETKEFHIQKFDFENAGKASTAIKKQLKQMNTDRKTLRRIAVAMYELEMNQVVHSEGGIIECTVSPEKVIIHANDNGPGIEDTQKALEEGFSTANEWIRSLGFGAGMGLPNAQRVADSFSIESKKGEGTNVVVEIYLKPKEQADETK